jgi:hypothetical protein
LKSRGVGLLEASERVGTMRFGLHLFGAAANYIGI